MKFERSTMRIFYVLITVCLFACNRSGSVKDAEFRRSLDSAVGGGDAAYEERGGGDADSTVRGKTYSNERFRDVTVRRSGSHTYIVEGTGQIFEANFGWVVEDGHQELKKGFEMTDAGAPEWGRFRFTVEVEKQRPNSTLILVLFESSAKDGSRQHELAIPLERPTTSPTSYQPPPAPARNRCRYANDASTLGIGLIMAGRRFTLFSDAMLTDPFVTIDLYEEAHWSVICPKFFEPEYGIAQFVCTDTTAMAYHVLTDYATAKYLPKTTGVFITWSSYIIGSFGIRRLTGNDDPAIPPLTLKQEPSESSKDLSVPNGLEMFCPVEIQGNWVKVKYDCFYNQEENPHEGEPCHRFIAQCKDPLTGWLQWKNESKLLIDIFLMP